MKGAGKGEELIQETNMVLFQGYRWERVVAGVDYRQGRADVFEMQLTLLTEYVL